MNRLLRSVLPVVVGVAALVGLGSTLQAPQAESRATVSPPTRTTVVPTPTVVLVPTTTATASIVTRAPAPPQTQPQPKPQPAAPPAAPAVDAWHAVFNDMVTRLPGTYRIGEPAGCNCWGVTPHDTDTVFVSPRTPVSRVADVMRHESGHIRMTRVYGSASKAYEGLKAYGGWEAVADCVARLIGARWTNYVTSCTAPMTTAARAILNGTKPA